MKPINLKPTSPNIIRLIKIHNPVNHVRPLSNYSNSPAYKLIEFLVEILSLLISLPNAFYVKNFLELIQNLKEISLNSNISLVFLDMFNIYINVPTQKLKIVIHNIPELSSINKEIKQNILYGIIIKHYHISHNGKIYQQKEGQVIAIPLSPTMFLEISCSILT